MTNGPTRRGPYAKTAARRRAILAAAKAPLARRGYRNTSIKRHRRGTGTESL